MIYLFALVLSLTAVITSGQSECSCRVPIRQQAECSVPVFNRLACQRAGCCWSNAPLAFTSRCYQRDDRYCFRETRQRQSCSIAIPERPCRLALERTACEARGCCFNGLKYPFCFIAAPVLLQQPQVSPWSVWSTCSLSCSPGTTIRSRLCLNQDQSICVQGGYVLAETKSCNTELCRRWSQWSQASCSATCGPGLSTRRRSCWGVGTRGAPQCSGASEPCNVARCPAIRPPPPSWSAWAPWSACFPVCAPGKRMRSRNCVANGRPADERRCRRVARYPGATETKSCNFDMCEMWTTWQPYRECTAVCGATTEKRRLLRVCLRQVPTARPTSAFFRCNSREEFCNTVPCPTRPTVFRLATTVQATTAKENVASWENWRPWSKCSTTCGEGNRIRIRRCLYTDGSRAPGNAACGAEKDAIESISCSQGPCPDDTTTSRPSTTMSTATSAAMTPDDASWGRWSVWSDCSASCGSGITIRIRPCRYSNSNQAPTTHCGTQEKSTQSMMCGRRPCDKPVTDAATTVVPTLLTTTSTAASTLDATGEAFWGLWQAWSLCSTNCSPGTKLRTRICKYSDKTSASGKCSGPAVTKSTCNNRLCPEWEPWTAAECTVTCSSNDTIPGVQVNTRQCKTTERKTASEKCYVVANVCKPTEPCPDGPATPTFATTSTESTPTESSTPAKSTTKIPATRNSTLVPSKPKNDGDINSKECNTEICRVWSQWRTQPCKQSCGNGGTQVRQRTCESGRITPGTPEACYRRSQLCENNPPCQDGPADPKLDVLFLVDSSTHVDDCAKIEETTGFSPPLRGEQLTNTITPTYARMKKFMKDFVNGWRGISNDGTRISIQLFSNLCSPRTKSNLHVEKRFNESHIDVAQYIDELPYLCGEYWLDWALQCAITPVMTTSFGDRADVPNAVVAILSSAPSTAQPSDFVLGRILKRIVGKGSTVLSATATPLENLDSKSRRKYEESTRKISCTNGRDCSAYLGSIWDLKRSQVVEKIRGALQSAGVI